MSDRPELPRKPSGYRQQEEADRQQQQQQQQQAGYYYTDSSSSHSQPPPAIGPGYQQQQQPSSSYLNYQYDIPQDRGYDDHLYQRPSNHAGRSSPLPQPPHRPTIDTSHSDSRALPQRTPIYPDQLSPVISNDPNQRPMSLASGIIAMYAGSDEGYDTTSDSRHSTSLTSTAELDLEGGGPASSSSPSPASADDRAVYNHSSSHSYAYQQPQSTASRESFQKSSRPLPPPPLSSPGGHFNEPYENSPQTSANYYQPYDQGFSAQQYSDTFPSVKSGLSSNGPASFDRSRESGSRDQDRGHGNSNDTIKPSYSHNPKQNSAGSVLTMPATPQSRNTQTAPSWSPALSTTSLPSVASRIQTSHSSSSSGSGLRNGFSNDVSEGRGDADDIYYNQSVGSPTSARRNDRSQDVQPTSPKSNSRPPIPVIVPPPPSFRAPSKPSPLSPRSQQSRNDASGTEDYGFPASPGRSTPIRDPSPRLDYSARSVRLPNSLSRQSSSSALTTTGSTPQVYAPSDGITRDQYGYPIDRKTSQYVDVHSRTDSYGNTSSGLLSPAMSPTTRTFSSTNQTSNHPHPTSPYSYNPISHIAPASQSQYQSSSSLTEYVDFALLSNLAVILRDSVPRGEQIKGSIAYPGAFTGRDVVSTLQNLIPKELAADSMGVGNDLRSGQLKDWDDGIGSEQNNRSRRVALLVAKTLKKQLFFHEVDWGEGELTDGVEDVYMFLGDTLGESGSLSPSGGTHTIQSSSTDVGSKRKSSGRMKQGGNNQSSDPFSDDWASPLDSHGPLDLGLRLPAQSANSASDLDELPTGIFTPLTSCYSPLCGKPGSPIGTECYSSSCPRNKNSPLRRHISSASVSQPSSDGFSNLSLTPGSAFSPGGSRATTPTGGRGVEDGRNNAKAWVEIVPKDLLDSLPKQEIDRQNAIHETIQKEEEYLADIELLEDLFVKGLERPNERGDPPPIPIGPARDAFIAEVFSNNRTLAAHVRSLVERLHIRQREEHPIVQSIGDIFLDAALEWAEAYEFNIANFPLAKSRVRREMQISPKFKEFIETCRRHPAAHRHELDHFLYRPTVRLQRYHLHFEAILKKTDESNPDKVSLTQAMEIIDNQCKTAQAGVAASELKVQIRDYAWGLAAKRNKAAVDMDLLSPERQLVHQSRVFRKPDFTDFEWTDLLAVLFDNYLIVVKPKKLEQGDTTSARFVLAKRPIPVEMMELSGFNDPSVSRAIGLANFHIRERDNRDLWPFTIHHIGGRMEPLTLFSTTKEGRDEWKKKLDEAIGLRGAVQEANKVFESHVLSDSIFAVPSAGSIDPEKAPPGADPSLFHGKVTCAVPFATADGRSLVAIGCSDGVWIGLRHDPRSLRKVLHLKLVSQCAVLEPFGIFVVLADKVLISYSLEALVPSSNASGGSHSTPRPPQKLSGNRDVVFFSVGVLKERTLLVYMKRRANECVFRALEPVMNAPRADQGRTGGGFFGKFGKDAKNPDWFRIYKTFFIPSEAYSMQFLRSKLCVVCARGFEIMNLESLLPGTIPDFSHCPRDDPRIQAIAKRVETAKPLGMFKTSDSEFLLCYDSFACYVDRVGEPIRLDNVIDWEGAPQSVAFQAPYVLAFDNKFVEIRDSSSGRLVQIIRGTDLRYVSGSSTVRSTGASRLDDGGAGTPSEGVQDGTIIITQRKKSSNGRTPFDYQSVLELVSNAPQMIGQQSLSHSNTVISRAGWI